jgi:Tol biopolymer transport system component/predicted Ser/Thr protein kinase
MTGTTVGHYEILEKIGEGGMGQVYKARDVLLNRIAALKLLPAESAGVVNHDDRRQRFLQEAQAASALNHPNIVTIYEVGRAEGRDFIAMELVQGRPLDEVIGAKPLPIDNVIAYGVQIADALATAHAAGIVHRDLKPGNVMVSESGVVKVLDFGLAKITAPVSNDSDATRTVFAASPKTTEGMILGTVSYMSPEQAEGKPVGPGTDIFSFGALLYEMLTGRRAFQGESTVSTLAQVLTAEPKPITTELPALPRELSSIVARCLRKTSAKRWQSIADVRIALEEFKQDLDSGALDRPAAALGKGSAKRWWAPVAITAIIAAAVAAFFAFGRQPSVASPEIWKLRRLTSDAGASMNPALSRDGRLLAYTSDRAAPGTMDLWVQQIDGGDPVQLTRDLGYCQEAEFSPDASRLVVRCGTNPDVLYSVPTLGGLARKIGEGAWARFSPDGSKIAYVGHASSGGGNSFWIVPAQGGAPKEITPQRPVFGGAVWRPDGRGLFFIGGSTPPETRGDWFFVPVDGGAEVATGAVTRLEAGGFGLGRELAITAGGFLFGDGTFDSSNLYRLPFDAPFNKPSGDVMPVTVGAGVSFQPSASQDGNKIAFAIAANIANNIWKASVDPATGAVIGQTSRVTSGLGFNRAPSPARDGKRIAYLGGSDTAPEVRVRDLATGSDRRLAEAKMWSYAVLSPDGSKVAYDSDQRNNSATYVVSTAGGQPTRVCASCGRPVEWLPGGNALLFDNGGRSGEIKRLDLDTGKSTVVLKHAESPLAMPRLSPDGRHVTFTRGFPGRKRHLYVAPFTGELVPESEWTLLVDGADFERQPFWSPTGQFIYFLSERDGTRCIWAQRVEPATGKAVGAPFGAYHAHGTRFSLEHIQDVAHIGLSVANGQMFLASFEMEPNIWLAERRQVNQK